MKKEKGKTIKDREKRLAVVRVRGSVHVRREIKDTLKLLNLNRVNHCVVIDDRPQYKGMVQKVKDYVTWGEINQETLEQLLVKRGRLRGNYPLTEDYLSRNTPYKTFSELSKAIMEFKIEIKDIPGLKPVFRLHPPSHGFERKGIKKPYTLGGALGYRGENINQLLMRMI